MGTYKFVNYLSLSGKIEHNYLIQEGYEGSVIVFYNLPNREPLRVEEEKTVVPIKVDTLVPLKDTAFEQHGIIFTSTPRIKEEALIQSFYYVDKEGNRTKIDDYCIYSGTSGSSNYDNKEIQYESFQITETECGEDFYLEGNENYHIQTNEALNYWFAHLGFEKTLYNNKVKNKF